MVKMSKKSVITITMAMFILLIKGIGSSYLSATALAKEGALRPMATSLFGETVSPAVLREIRKQIGDFGKEGVFNVFSRRPFKEASFILGLTSDNWADFGSWQDTEKKYHHIRAHLRGISRVRVRVSCEFMAVPAVFSEPEWLLVLESPSGELYFYRFTRSGDCLRGVEIDPEYYRLQKVKTEMAAFAEEGVFDNRNKRPFTAENFTATLTHDKEFDLGGWNDELENYHRLVMFLPGLKKGDVITGTCIYKTRSELPAGYKSRWVIEVDTRLGKRWFYFEKGVPYPLRVIDLSQRAYFTINVMMSKAGRLDNPRRPPFPDESFDMTTVKNGFVIFGTWETQDGKHHSLYIGLRRLDENHKLTVRRLFNTDRQWLIAVDTNSSYYGRVYYYVTPQKTLRRWKWRVRASRENRFRSIEYVEIFDAITDLKQRQNRPYSLTELAGYLGVDKGHLKKEIERLNRIFEPHPGAPYIELLPEIEHVFIATNPAQELFLAIDSAA